MSLLETATDPADRAGERSAAGLRGEEQTAIHRAHTKLCQKQRNPNSASYVLLGIAHKARRRGFSVRGLSETQRFLGAASFSPVGALEEQSQAVRVNSNHHHSRYAPEKSWHQT